MTIVAAALGVGRATVARLQAAFRHEKPAAAKAALAANSNIKSKFDNSLSLHFTHFHDSIHA